MYYLNLLVLTFRYGSWTYFTLIQKVIRYSAADAQLDLLVPIIPGRVKVCEMLNSEWTNLNIQDEVPTTT